MKYMKMFGWLVVVASVLMVFAGIASATELTSPKGTKLEKGAVIEAELEGAVQLDGTIDIQCQKAGGDGEVTNAGGPSDTVTGFAVFGTFSECGKDTVTVLETGTVEIHSLGNGNGTLTSSDAEVTVQVHRTIFGFPITTHCIYATNHTDIGVVTGTGTTGGKATHDIGSAPIPQIETDGACGESAILTGTLVVTAPEALYVD